MGRWLAWSALVLVCDQLSKFALSRVLHTGEIEITPFFNLVLVYNRGAAFSFLSSASGWQRELFIAIALVASVWIGYLLRRHSQERLFCSALSLILGGALGNLIDRLRLGVVVDFFDFHLLGYHWPAFNVADSAITVGALLLVWEAFHSREARGEGRKTMEPPINADKRR